MSRLTADTQNFGLVMDMWLHQSEFLIPLHPIPSQNLSVPQNSSKVIVTDEFLLILESS